MNELPLSLTDVRALALIVAHRSFRKAADELGLSASTLSHLMRTLEARLGVRLLNRTTRSVSPTPAGERLLGRLKPVLREFALAVDEVNEYRDLPSGTLRINASDQAARVLMEGALPTFLRRFPQMSVDLVTDGRFVDIVANGFDAGIRLGESIPQDMIAVPIGPQIRFITVASPDYLRTRSLPLTPDDLLGHQCIGIRMPSGKPYRWEFEKHGQLRTIDPVCQLTLDSRNHGRGRHFRTWHRLCTRARSLASFGGLATSESSGRLVPANPRIIFILSGASPYPFRVTGVY